MYVAIDQMSVGFGTKLSEAWAALSGTLFTALEFPAHAVLAERHLATEIARPVVAAVSCGFATPANLAAVTPENIADALNRWAATCEVAREFGAGLLTVYVDNLSKPDSDLAMRLSCLADAADRMGVQVVVEFADVAAAVANGLWAELRGHCGGLIADLASIARHGRLDLVVPGLDPTDVRWVHVADVAGNRRVLPGDGALPLSSTLRLLHAGGALLGVSVEVPLSAADATASVVQRVATLSEQLHPILADVL